MKRAWFFLLTALLLLGSCQSNQGERMYERAINLWKEKRYEESIQNFIALTTAYPEDELVDDSLFWIANIYEHYLKEEEQAALFYRSLSKEFPQSEYALRSTMALARIFEGKDQDRQSLRKALLVRQSLDEKALSEELRDKNRLKLALLYVKLKQYEQARFHLKELIEVTVEQNLIAKAYHLIGTSYYLEGESELAEITFLEVEKRFKKGRQSLASALSLAELYEELNRLNEAIGIYQTILERVGQQEILYGLALERIPKLKARMKRTQQG